MKIETPGRFWIAPDDSAVDAAFRMAFAERGLTEAMAAAECIQGEKAPY